MDCKHSPVALPMTHLFTTSVTQLLLWQLCPEVLIQHVLLQQLKLLGVMLQDTVVEGWQG